MASTPSPGDRKHHPTPQKAKIQGVIEYCEKNKIDYYKKDVFEMFGVPKTSGHRIVADTSARRHHNKPNQRETRGRKPIVTPEQMKEMEEILEKTGIEGRALTWQQLGIEAGVDACGDTIKSAMGTMGYRKCIACTKSWTAPPTAERRLAYAKEMLSKYPTSEHWKH
ncbi:MAG: hypothetical protein M1823_000384, partial [Watsoniomyces obsoletus]